MFVLIFYVLMNYSPFQFKLEVHFVSDFSTRIFEARFIKIGSKANNVSLKFNAEVR